MNRRKLIVGIAALGAGIILSISAFGQYPTPDATVVDTTLLTNPKFLITIVAGVLMALGFQFVLTNLSVALGITAIGNIRKKGENLLYDRDKYGRDKDYRENIENRDKDYRDRSNIPLNENLSQREKIYERESREDKGKAAHIDKIYDLEERRQHRIRENEKEVKNERDRQREIENERSRDLERRARKEEREDKREDRKERREERREEKKLPTRPGVRFMSAAGAWTLITCAISLFLACMLAVKLSMVTSDTLGLTLGLVIWAIFSLTMIYMESRAIGNVISGLFGTALSAIRAGYSGVSSMFAKSEAAQKAEDVADVVRKEVYQFMNETDMSSKMNDVIEKIRPNFDAHQFRKELADLLNDVKIDQAEISPREKELYLRVAEKQPNFSKTDISNLDNIFESVVASLGLSGISRQVGGLGAKASSYVKEEYLPQLKDKVEHIVLDRSTPETNPEIVRAEIDEIFSHQINPKNIIENKGKVFNKYDVATVIASQKGVSTEEALDVADQVESALNAVLRESNIRELAGSKLRDSREQISETVRSKKEEYMGDLENRFENLFNRINRPELDYNVLKREFEYMMQNPSEAPDVIRRRLNQMDAETAVAMMTATGKLNRAEAENVVRKFEEAKANVSNKLDYTQNMINEKTREAAMFAMEQTENVRKAAVAASWWLFFTLVLTGAAAGLGGIVGM